MPRMGVERGFEPQGNMNNAASETKAESKRGTQETFAHLRNSAMARFQHDVEFFLKNPDISRKTMVSYFQELADVGSFIATGIETKGNGWLKSPLKLPNFNLHKAAKKLETKLSQGKFKDEFDKKVTRQIKNSTNNQDSEYSGPGYEDLEEALDTRTEVASSAPNNYYSSGSKIRSYGEGGIRRKNRQGLQQGQQKGAQAYGPTPETVHRGSKHFRKVYQDRHGRENKGKHERTNNQSIRFEGKTQEDFLKDKSKGKEDK